MEVPQFTTLNADTLPKGKLLEALDDHQPKFDSDLLEALLRESGAQICDARVLKVVSCMMESQMLKIVHEMKALHGEKQQTKFTFEDLQKAMSEFGVALKRPPFLAEKQQ
jgi:hypothetical protein